jgi:hypothetical protein
LWFSTLGYQNGIALTSTLFDDAPILSITLYLYNMLSNGDSHVLLPMDQQQQYKYKMEIILMQHINIGRNK